QVTEDLSVLAEGILRATVRRALDTVNRSSNSTPGFCVLAFGKLGGGELNYSSDIDLLAVLDESGANNRERAELYSRVVEMMVTDLSRHTEEGTAYRVDLRLRPYGAAGQSVHTLFALEEYYKNSAEIWEIQALLKLRPVAGDAKLGKQTADQAHAFLREAYLADDIASSIRRMRTKAHHQLFRRSLAAATTTDIKSGPGGIRDIEFLVQGLQLMHLKNHPSLLEGNTLAALDKLVDEKVLEREVADGLAEDYRFLRRTEHFLQLYDDRQTHSLPRQSEDLEALGKRVSESAETTANAFGARLERCRERIEHAFNTYLPKTSSKHTSS
ncbi:MAG: hypothetical protein GF344_13405, partial [Chitinivibrionales bacterium]|nr:hypothetical protein [Chitinivibrionales bacterium]MBD3357727.1 hypothetical protein [Chitinivibrionales bacterium]